MRDSFFIFFIFLFEMKKQSEKQFFLNKNHSDFSYGTNRQDYAYSNIIFITSEVLFHGYRQLMYDCKK